jgi:Xaa-Pro aminopeptidase
MRTMQPALKNGRNVWDRVNLPPSEFEGRLARIRAEMKSSGIDLLLLYGRGFSDYADPCYVSNFMIRLARGTLAAVPAEGPVVVFFEGASRGLPSLLATTWVKELKAANDVAKDCAKHLRDKGLIPCTVGLGRLEELMPLGQFRTLTEALSGSTVVDAGHLVPCLRVIKSPRECDQVRRAGRIVKRSFDWIGSAPFGQMNEHLVEAAARREARLEGAEDFRMLVARPDDAGWTFRPAEDRRIEPGRPVIVYASAEFERYWAEGVRTYVAGQGSFSEVPGERTPFYPPAVEAVRAGRRASDVWRDILDGARESGIELIRTYGFGGGLGLSPKEAPRIEEASDGRIEEGMCLSLRLAARDEALGAVMRGGTLVVGENRVDVVTG